MELEEWLQGAKWSELLKDDVVKQLAVKIKSHVEGSEIDNDNDDDALEGAARMKLVVVGDGAVGKTSLLIRFAKGEFPTDYLPTVFENYTAQYKKDNGDLVLLHLWDTAGQEDYDRLRPLSYPGADVVVLAYNTISQASFEAITEKWAPEVRHYIPDVPLLLVGTKVDLRAAKTPDPNTGSFEPISTDEGAKLAKELDAEFLEISAKTGENLKECFAKAVEIGLAGKDGDGASGAAIGGARRTKKKNTCALL